MGRRAFSPFLKTVSFAGTVLLAAGVLTVSTAPASAAPVSTAPISAAPARVDSPTGRWIVQLAEPSVAAHSRAAGKQRLDASDADSTAYAGHLRDSQRGFADRMRQVAPQARVSTEYQTVLNGMAVRMSGADAAKVRALPGVVGVTPDVAYQLDMFATPEQIGAPALWQQVGGQAKAGEGVKVAIIDSGIFVRKAADGSYAGNPCFNDAGYTAPRGYPKGDTRFTNNKVIVARSFFRPDDPPIAGEDTAIQGTNQASPHGTHVAGTVACNAGTPVNYQGANVTITGIAPRAYLMNYRVFYPSQSSEDFQNANAYVVELVQAIDQAVKDGADVISNSWGSSYQNTLAWPDPMVQAAEDAVDAGVTMVFANSNAGPDNATTGSPANSPKVIGVGAVTKNATIVPGVINVTAPAPVPPALTKLGAGPAGFGPQLTTSFGPAVYLPAQAVATDHSSTGCSLAGDASPYPAGSLTGKIAVIERGVCDFSAKVFNAQRGGAVAALVYNSAANGDTIQSMGPGAHAAEVTIPSWFLRRSDGLAMVSFSTSSGGTAQAEFSYGPQATANVGDVMAAFSSRGPTQDKILKPDLVAPGVDVVSSGYGTGAYPAPFTGFGSVSGTSMATPHVAGSAALLLQLHPKWTPEQVKSALMNTATEDVFLNTAKTSRAGVLDRGAGRIDLAKAANPGLTLSPPSISGGEVTAGTSRSVKLRATDVGGAGTWDVSATASSGLSVGLSATSIDVRRDKSSDVSVQLTVPASAAAGDYQGDVVLTRRGGGGQLHAPLWIRVVPAQAQKQVLLVDDDGSSASNDFADYAAVYRGALDRLGVSYDYRDVWNNGFPSFNQLFAYRVVVVFTGDNDSFDTSGFSLSDHNHLSEWLDSGGRLLAFGQNFAETSDDNTSFSSTRLGRARLYHGYLGVAEEDGSLYTGAPPAPSAAGEGPFAGQSLTLTQSSIEGTSPLGDTDTYNAMSTMTRFFRPLSSDAAASWGVGFGRSSEPSLGESRLQFHYRGAILGFGLEGVTGTAAQDGLTDRLLDWLLDQPAVTGVDAQVRSAKTVTFTAAVTSSAGAPFTSFRWNFGDGSPVETTTSPTVVHRYRGDDQHKVTVEATDALGHRALGSRVIG
jgi:subtilisin family serine protease